MRVFFGVTVTRMGPQVKQAVEGVGQSILLQFARKVIRIARRLTIRAPGPSPRGTPPHEHYGDLDRSLAVTVDEATGNVVAGPRASIVGRRGSVLEFASTYDPNAGRDEFGRFLRGHASRKAPSGARWAHPFMQPAFEEAVAVGRFEGGAISNSFI